MADLPCPASLKLRSGESVAEWALVTAERAVAGQGRPAYCIGGGILGHFPRFFLLFVSLKIWQ